MWVIFALTAAIVSSYQAIVIKKTVSRMHPVTASAMMFLATVPYAVLLLLVFPISSVGPMFWLGLLGTSLLNIAANAIAFIVAKREDVSYLAPIAALNPLMTTIVSVFTLGEYPGPLSVVGVIAIVIGTMFLEKNGKANVLSTLIQFSKKTSVRLMLLAYIIWALTPTFEKMSVLNTIPQNPIALMIGLSSLTGLGILAVATRFDADPIKAMRLNIRTVILMGLLSCIVQFTAFQAFAAAPLGPATAVFRTSMLWSVIFARFFLGEKKASARLGAAALMFIGVVLLVV